MTYVIGRLRGDLRVPFGTNLLWDPAASLAAAVATGASFIREVLTGVFDTDMGLLAPDFGGSPATVGRSALPTSRCSPTSPRSSAARSAAASVAERADQPPYLGVDALLISGPAAGVNAEHLRPARGQGGRPHVPVLANTGVKHETVEEVLSIVDGAIVGTSLKVDGYTWNPVDPERVRDMMRRVRDVRASIATA